MKLAVRFFCLGLLCACAQVLAFDQQQLAQQLEDMAVVRGEFVQEKFLRGLARPLRSEGRFVLARGHGLLWNLQQPLQREYRITGQGVALMQDGQWQLQGNQDAAARQSRLFLAVLQGDQQGLREEFELQLQGTAEDWQLTLLPRSLLLKQVFTRIEVSGGHHVNRIELLEATGDRTLMQMLDVRQATQLQPDEDAAFGS